MSLCLRYIEDCLIREDFLTFIPIYDTSGKWLPNIIMLEVDKLGLKKENCTSSTSGVYIITEFKKIYAI